MIAAWSLDPLAPILRFFVGGYGVSYLNLAKAVSLEGQHSNAARLVAGALGGVVETRAPLTTAGVAAMPLSDFALAGLVVEVRSEILGEVVVLASDNALLDPGERRTVYRARELAELVGLGAADLRRLHGVKRVFGGSLEAS